MTLERLKASLADGYHIERALGEGGMATVYLAHDLKHDRDVAIKVLHPDLGAALGAERFLAEIRTTARLQHPHILPLLDSGVADGLLYYVMPLVTGETLRARLVRERQLPIDDAVRIAREVADALGYAHGRAVIHRDIKPENILLQDGHALVADFGIALAVQTAGGSRMTQTGLSLGTPQYMSPEQAMGERTIDARSDVYALGAVTYEMLAGEPPFSGPTVQAIVAKVMTERPTPLQTIRDTVPAPVEHAVFTALAKLPADRFASTAEFSAALVSMHGRSFVPRHAPASARRRWMIAALGLCAGLALVAALWGWLRPIPTEPVIRVAIAFPPGQELRPQYFGFSFALSHDGSRLAYVGPGSDATGTQLWIRPLYSLSATPVPGTAGIYSVEWSPDDRLILLGSNSAAGPENFVVPSTGGEVTRLAGVREATWGSDGAIYFFPRGGKGILARQQIGGRTDTVRKALIDTSYSDRPLTVLPGAQAVLFAPPLASPDDTAGMRIESLAFGSGARTTVAPGVFAWYVPDAGLLRVAADGGVYLEQFDPARQRISGASVLVTRVAIGSNSGDRYYPQVSVARNGTMVYMAGVLLNERLNWIGSSSDGAAQATDIIGNLWGLAISPDGTQVAFSSNARAGSGNGTGPFDVWVENLKTGARTRLTTSARNMRPSWSPDGKYVLWARIGGEVRQGLVERRADASEPEHVVLSRAQFGHSVADGHWLPDHKRLLVSTYVDGVNGRDIYAITPGRDSVARPFAVMAGNQTAAIASPDGSVVAYTSDESGVRELYVQPLTTDAGRVKVSEGGASSARWSRDGRKLYYWNQRSELVAASIQVKPTLQVVATDRIAAGHVVATGGGQNGGLFDIAPDGRALVAEDLPGTFQLILVRNWKAGLPKGGQ